MKTRIVYQIDSFTKEKFKGNPAGVVVNADGLSSDEMQLIARELNNSETAFLFDPTEEGYDVEVRYFTPTTEVPICGHATIAAVYAKALESQMDSCVFRIKTKIGILPIEIIQQGGDYQITMTQGEFDLSPAFDTETTQILLNALGLERTDLDERCPVQIASTGHSKVMIGIRSRKKLNKLSPNQMELALLSERISCNGYFVFTLDSGEEETLTYGRMFAPAIGITEDPVTGNANGPLGGYLVQNRIVNFEDDYFEFNAKQGEKINRLGTINVSVTSQNNIPKEIKIKGNAVVIFKTELSL